MRKEASHVVEYLLQRSIAAGELEIAVCAAVVRGPVKAGNRSLKHRGNFCQARIFIPIVPLSTSLV